MDILTKSLPKLSIIHITLIFITIAFWATIEALGPIFFIFEESFWLLDVARVTGHALFHAILIFSIISIFGKRAFAIMIGLTTIYALLAYANLLYFRSFGICFPFNMMLQFQQLNGLSQSIIDLMRWYDVLFLIVPIIAYIAYGKLKPQLTHFSRKLHFGVLGICAVIAFCPVLYVINYRQFDITQLHKEIHLNYAMAPIRTYRGFGLLPSLSYQIWNPNNAVKLSTAEEEEIDMLINNQHVLFCNSSIQATPKKNCVIMLMEAFCSRSIQEEYMPTLYSLCNQGTTLYCPNTKQLTQGGMSIGGQLVVMTGLHGLRNSTFVTDFRNNKYPSITSVMKEYDHNYYTFSAVSTDSNFWQQDVVNQQLSINELYGLKEIESATDAPYYNKHKWIDDKTLFEFSATKIANSEEPFCCVIVPSNMHSPYDIDDKIVCDISFSEITDPHLHEYLRRARYLDNQIAAFIQRLKDCGKYDDTLIVITSDHRASLYSQEMEDMLQTYIPAIFINTGADWTEQNERNKDVVFCHSQVYPTMLQLMGLRPEKYAGLFPPMTNIEATQEYDFANCAYETTTDKRIKQIYDIEEKIIRSSYFGVME